MRSGGRESVDGAAKEEDPYPVPKELWFLCDLMSSLGLDHAQLFLQPGLRQEILAVRDATTVHRQDLVDRQSQTPVSHPFAGYDR